MQENGFLKSNYLGNTYLWHFAISQTCVPGFMSKGTKIRALQNDDIMSIVGVLALTFFPACLGYIL